MRRVTLLLAMMALALVVGSGAGLAAIEFGTERGEFIEGSGRGDVLYGRGGHDSIAGRGGNDVGYGGRGGDALHGGSFRFDEIFRDRGLVPDGDDTLFGEAGDDCVWGGTGDDILRGGRGDDFVGTYCLDFLFDAGNDAMYGGPGDDFIIALEDRPGSGREERDIVHCGPGIDEVLYQRGVDVIRGCERKNRF